ncbi:DEAD/DEAH box helicase family protein [Xanthomonas cannabis]|uniref:DEAD/DEAH box helicase n=1 Tax=Xanthomonas cannabis TaxID=1885674 RepID=UPI0033A57EEE
MIDSDDAVHSIKTKIPAAKFSENTDSVEIVVCVEKEVEGSATLTTLGERAGKVTSAVIEIDGVKVAICFERNYKVGIFERALHAPLAAIENGVLDLGKSAEWKQHPHKDALVTGNRREKVAESWCGYPVLKEELRNNQGDVVRKGLRIAQAGALHAIAAHWSVKKNHALVVLPTGTGKTDVIIAAALLASAKRTLVLVPSDALRTQIKNKFISLGILEDVGSISESCLNPVVGVFKKKPKGRDDFEPLMRANVVITTTQMLLNISSSLLGDFLGIFDFIAFDEAHHLPAPSWTRISKAIADTTKVLSLTATPYRNDGKRLSGELIYQFPLRIAQQYGYFTKIDVLRVDQSASEIADIDIANAAVSTLRKDQQNGFKHIILARSKSIEHADRIFEIYNSIAPDLSPVILYTGLSDAKKNKAISALRNLESRVVVCVDMLGEGFDLSALKIAAMHELHKSLPVTLQFIGRFTRAADGVGSATVVINMSAPMAGTAVSDLFAEDADWNELVPQLSASAIDADIELQDLAKNLRQVVAPDDKFFEVSLLSPGLSLLLYQVGKFEPGSLIKGVGRNSILHQSWVDQDREIVIAITRDFSSPDWSKSKEALGFSWNLFIAAYDSNRHILMVNSTLGASSNLRLVRAVGGKDAFQIDGEKMFRVFDGLRRAILHNVGLYKRGQVRFQMTAGIDVGEHVSQAVQVGSSKSNLFAAGYDDGVKETIGASFKGSVWSMTSASIPAWISWAKKVTTKVFDASIATNSFLSFTLIPVEINSPPQVRVFSCIPPDELLPGSYHGEKHIRYTGSTSTVTQSFLDFNFKSADKTSLNFEVSSDGRGSAVFKITWANGFKISRVSGPDLYILDDGQEVSLQEYLSKNPPSFILVDGSELIGKYHYKYSSSPIYTYSSASMQVLAWGKTNIVTESKWKAGVARANSVQGFIISRLINGSSNYVIDDDDSGEVADIIAIEVDQSAKVLNVSFYHCKYSHGSAPGSRVADLYEVCGQAIKSCRMVNRPEDLIGHILRREKKLGGRPSRFEKGSESEIISLQKTASNYRMNLNVYIVQPGLSAKALTPDLSSILGAADNFVLEFTGRRLGVIGSR